MPRTREDIAKVTMLARVTGRKIRVREYETITKIEATDTLILVAIETFDVKYLTRETRWNKKGLKLVSIKRANSDSTWGVPFDEFTVWDDDFVPITDRHFGRVETIAEKNARVEHEQMCYRPGNADFPLDNATVTWADPATKRMARHWNTNH